MVKKKSTKATAGKKQPAKTPPKAAAPRKPRAVTRILRPQERARLAKPTVENYEEIAEEAIRTWLKYRKVVHVFGLTPAKMEARQGAAKSPGPPPGRPLAAQGPFGSSR